MTTHTVGKLWGPSVSYPRPTSSPCRQGRLRSRFQGPSLWQEEKGPSCPLKALSSPKVRNLKTMGPHFQRLCTKSRHREGCIIGRLGGRPTRAFSVLMERSRLANSVYSGYSGCLNPRADLGEETGSHGPDREARSMPATLGSNSKKHSNLQGTGFPGAQQ